MFHTQYTTNTNMIKVLFHQGNTNKKQKTTTPKTTKTK